MVVKTNNLFKEMNVVNEGNCNITNDAAVLQQILDSSSG